MSDEKLKAGSPVLGRRFLGEKAAAGEAAFSGEGAVHKTGFLLIFTVLAACLAWSQASAFGPYLMPLALVALAVGLIVCFVPATAPGLAPFYAILEGLLLGTVSSFYEGLYQGIVFQAAAGTLGVLVVMLAGYSSGLLKFGERGRAVIVACTGGLMLLYLLSFVAGLFGHPVAFLHQATPLGIAFSIFALVIASLNLSLDFQFIQEAESEGLAKRMEWYAAFGVLVTLIWVYLEILRLLSKLRRR